MWKKPVSSFRVRTALLGLVAGVAAPAIVFAVTSIGTDITTTGKVGIGTTNPAAALEVSASGTFDTHLRLTNTNTGTAGPGLHFDAVSRDWVIYASNPGAGAGDRRLVFRDYTLALDRLTIDFNGDVGIATTTPSAKLFVLGTDPATTTMIVKGANSQSADLFQLHRGTGAVTVRFSNNGDLIMEGNGGTAVINTGSTATVDLFNTVPTTVNFAGAATALNIGATSGNTSIKNFLTVNKGLLVLSPSSTAVALQVKGAASQSSDLQQWQDSSAASVATMSATGTLLLNGSLRVGAAGNQITRHLSSVAATVASSSINAVTCADYGGATVPGAAIGDAVTATPFPATNGIEDVSLSWNAYVGAPNVVTIRACNPTAGAINTDDNQSWRLDIWQH